MSSLHQHKICRWLFTLLLVVGLAMPLKAVMACVTLAFTVKSCCCEHAFDHIQTQRSSPDCCQADLELDKFDTALAVKALKAEGKQKEDVGQGAFLLNSENVFRNYSASGEHSLSHGTRAQWLSGSRTYLITQRLRN